MNETPRPSEQGQHDDSDVKDQEEDRSEPSFEDEEAEEAAEETFPASDPPAW